MNLRAGVETETFAPGGILADAAGLQHRKVTLPDGTAALVAGTLLGKVLTAGAASAAKSGGNTGGGSLTLDVTTPVLAGAQPGVYKIRAITLASNGGVFDVEAPDGHSIGNVKVGDTFADQIKFVLADVGTDFALGDGFDVTVDAGSLKYKKSLAAATDGSQIPDAILYEDTVAASGADIEAMAAIAGTFNADALTYGTGHTEASVKEALRLKGIYLR